ncbi:Polyhydroxyalkanoate synthesis regulator phasin [Paenibacillus algorifonticola]|uniref:Polyhydroxyalkanoate synthesis regulator phasin n=1 Tax=Paenibacillus algorifonticola TaxID=684063 RepID=A0A1I2FR58_9BACL|nr:ATP synthase subunit B [Paenibacillus algorifonticola]SFF07258.1 Polyhydroxyalkanoate synthesis regulator phasin [Paenibacillus algorifonticola]
MKDTIIKAMSLAMGIAVTGKEQVEKTIDELVQKGQVSKEDSKTLTNTLVQKGEELREQIEAMAQERVRAILSKGKIATREDIERIEKRLDALEQKEQSGD